MKNKVSYFDKVKSNKVIKDISIDDWLSLIKNNDIDDIDYARSYGKGTNEYEYYKTIKLPCITPNFSYKGTKNDKNIIKSSGFIFVDIDINDELKTEQLKLDLKENPYIYAMWKSLSKKGLSILCKGKGIKKNNFNEFYELIDEMNIPYDKKAAKKSQFNVLSRDPEIYINKSSKTLEIKNLKKGYSLKKEEEDISGDEPFLVSDKIKNLNDTYNNDDPFLYKSQLPEYKEDVVYIPEGKLYFDCFIPFNKDGTSQRINKGNRNYVLSTYTNNLILLNEDKSLKSIFNVIMKLNKSVCIEPLSEDFLHSMVKNKFDNKENLKPINPKLKYYWINPKVNDKLNKYHEYKKNKSFNKINHFFTDEILNVNEKITMKLICKYTGLSLSTIKRYITPQHKLIYKSLNQNRKK